MKWKGYYGEIQNRSKKIISKSNQSNDLPDDGYIQSPICDGVDCCNEDDEKI